MPLYEFKCTTCGTFFEEFTKMGATTVKSPCCQTDSDRTWRAAPGFIGKKMKPSSKSAGNHPLDNGVPFGEVPGDDDYDNIDSQLSPKP